MTTITKPQLLPFMNERVHRNISIAVLLSTMILVNCRDYTAHKILINSSSDLVESHVSCTNEMDPIWKRFRSVSKQSMFEMLSKRIPHSKLYCINTESALHFTPFYGENIYHTLFEDLIPIYEILKSDSLLSKWLNESYNDTIKVLNLGESSFKKKNPYIMKYFQMLYPHIDFSFRNIDWHQSDYTTNNRIYLVKHLVAELIDVVTTTNIGIEPTVVNFELMSIKDQIELVFVTDILIMIHGAALSHILYLPPYATVVEVYPYTFPYHLQGIVNWVRYSLRDIPIAHAPFDIIEPNAILYNGNHSLPLCIQPPGSTFKDSFPFIWTVDSIIIDIERFHSVFTLELEKWHTRSNFIPAMTREDFLAYSISFKELWYNKLVSSRNANKSTPLPSCKSSLNKLLNSVKTI
eukprot:gene11062-23123_t